MKERLHCTYISTSLCFFSGYNSCPVFTASGYNCTTSNNCTKMVCNSSALLVGSSSISVQRCADPPMVDLEIHGVLAENLTNIHLRETFRENRSVSQGGVDITVNVWRNWTALVFSVSFPLTLM